MNLRHKIKLKEGYILIALTESEYKELDNMDDESFKKRTGFKKSQIYAKGSLDDGINIITNLIPAVSIRPMEKGTYEQDISSYKCFVGKVWEKRTIGNVIPHEDRNSSYNCLRQKLRDYDFGFVINTN